MNIIEKIRTKLLISLPLKFKKKILIDINHKAHQYNKRALIYFKVDPFFSKELRKAYTHTNNEEIVSMVNVLDSMGFCVDMIDRDANWDEIEALRKNHYDLYIGNAAGNGAPYHSEVLKNFDLKCKVIFGAGPEAYESNRLVQKVHDDFNRRHNQNILVRRLVKGGNFENRMIGADAVFVIGNEFSINSYKNKYKDLECIRIYPSTSPLIVPPRTRIINPKKFVYFGGSGLICKGLDLVLEAFDGLTGVELHIGGPAGETEFWNFYAPLLKRNPHIFYHGFVVVGGSQFNKITDDAAFAIFPGSAEGATTSVLTVMARGLVPYVTYETGIDTEDFGFRMMTRSIQDIRDKVVELSQMNQDELQERSRKSYQASQKYTLNGFENSFRDALISVIEKHKN